MGAVSRGVRMRFGLPAGAWRRVCCRADGVFLGRFAHDPAALAAVVEEAAALP